MDGSEYDVVIMGTGVTESILSGLLSMDGKKVLHIDRNPFYGDSGASLNVTSLWNKFLPNEPVPPELGANREWNVDLIPKFVMAYGKLVKLIIKTKVSDYLSWKCVEGTYVYQWKKGGFFSKEGGKIEKVPANDKEALSSDLMSLFEKRRCQKFFQFVQQFDPKKPETFKKNDPKGKKFGDFMKYFELEDNTIDFVGHAIALYETDDFINKPAVDVIGQIQLYMDSVGRFGDSPFIYPVYGLAGIPESFSRKCAVYGGTFMLNVGLKSLEYDAETNMSTFRGVFENEEGFAKTKMVIGNPAYFQELGHGEKIKPLGKAVRVICILDHIIPNTGNSNAVQIIIPQKQTGRKSDIYIMMIGPSHGVCKKGYYLAIISTTLEVKSIDEDLKLAYEIIGPIKHKFVTEEVMYTPISQTAQNNWHITDTLDPTSHFEQAADNVLKIYKSITGKDLDLNIENIQE